MNKHAPHRFISHDPDGTSFEMAGGAMFDPLNPDPGLMTIDDIATALSNACRFGGHVLPGCYLSTAQHSVLVAALADNDMEIQRYAILHDADEAFGIPDFLTPVKRAFPEIKAAQARIADAVEHRFNLDHSKHSLVKIADRQALYLERMAVKHRCNMHRWKEWLGNAEEPVGIKVVPLLPSDARELFISAYERVFGDLEPVTREWLSDRKGFEIEDTTELMPSI